MSIRENEGQVKCPQLEYEVEKLINDGYLPNKNYVYHNVLNPNFKSKGIYRLLIEGNKREFFEVELDHKYNLFFFICNVWHVFKKELSESYTSETSQKEKELNEIYLSLMMKGGN